MIQAKGYRSGPGFNAAEKSGLTLLRWILKSPSSMVQAISTNAKGLGSYKN